MYENILLCKSYLTVLYGYVRHEQCHYDFESTFIINMCFIQASAEVLMYMFANEALMQKILTLDAMYDITLMYYFPPSFAIA
jgi:hypothetical protein